MATGVGTGSVVTASFPVATGRYLRIVETGSASNWWSIAELQLYGVGSFAPVPAVLPRSGWSAAASSTCGSDVAGNALDDNSATRWSTGLNQAAGQFFTVDMKVGRPITKLTMDSGASSGDYARGYAVYVSTDGNTWGAPVATGNGTSALVTATFANQTARYVKVALTQGVSTNWWSIHELNVYGTGSSILLKEGWIASGNVNTSTASKGIDATLSTRWNTGAPQTNGQSFQVDMLALQSFNQITLDADGASNDYPRGYQVFVSNDGATWGAPVATGVGSSSLVSISFAPQSARYLKVVQTGSASNWWSVAELNVLGTSAGACRTN